MRVPGHADEVAEEKRTVDQAKAEAKRAKANAAADAKSDEG